MLIVAPAFLPSCSAVGIGAVLRDCESSYWVRWPLATGPRLPAQRDKSDGPVVGRRDLEGSRFRVASESDRMSATRGVLSGQNVWGGKVGLSRRDDVSKVVDRMSLAGWHVHLSGSACPAAVCAMGSSRGWGCPLNFQLPVCKLDSFCPFCLLSPEGAGK